MSFLHNKAECIRPICCSSVFVYCSDSYLFFTYFPVFCLFYIILKMLKKKKKPPLLYLISYWNGFLPFCQWPLMAAIIINKACVCIWQCPYDMSRCKFHFVGLRLIVILESEKYHVSSVLNKSDSLFLKVLPLSNSLFLLLEFLFNVYWTFSLHFPGLLTFLSYLIILLSLIWYNLLNKEGEKYENSAKR